MTQSSKPSRATIAVWGGEQEHEAYERSTQVPVVHSVSFGYQDIDHWQAVARKAGRVSPESKTESASAQFPGVAHDDETWRPSQPFSRDETAIHRDTDEFTAKATGNLPCQSSQAIEQNAFIRIVAVSPVWMQGSSQFGIPISPVRGVCTNRDLATVAKLPRNRQTNFEGRLRWKAGMQVSISIQPERQPRA